MIEKKLICDICGRECLSPVKGNPRAHSYIVTVKKRLLLTQMVVSADICHKCAEEIRKKVLKEDDSCTS